jgi:hypothetical protein
MQADEWSDTMRALTATILAACLAAFVIGTGPVFAQIPEHVIKDAYKKLLTEVDKNRDAKISKAEHSLLWKDSAKAESNWKMWDLNKDGFVTEEEYIKAIRNMARPAKK